jgi:hypothetical protein
VHPGRSKQSPERGDRQTIFCRDVRGLPPETEELDSRELDARESLDASPGDRFASSGYKIPSSSPGASITRAGMAAKLLAVKLRSPA